MTPPRASAEARAPRFVVQEHAARTMHWDLRLEHDGVLWSWVIPKGLPPAPSVSRLAIRTDDHPLEFLELEGHVPPGAEGGGTLRTWDQGTYELDAATSDKDLRIRLHGERGDGEYLLARLPESTRGEWVVRRIDQPRAGWLPLPARVEPMLAVMRALPEDEEGWAFEVKWDGIRAVVFADGARVRIETRTHNDITEQYPELHRLGRALGMHQAVLDGEIVALDEDGRPSFQRLQSRFGLTSASTIRTRTATVPLTYMAFDLLHLDGYDLTGLPYEQRRTLLRELLADGASWRVPAHHVGTGTELLAAVVEQGMEGIVAKRRGSAYAAGRRNGDWRKIKHVRRQEFVVGGWTDGRGARADTFGSLLVGAHDGHGRLTYVGSVGSGFAARDLEALTPVLRRSERTTSPFEVNSPDAGSRAEHWRPQPRSVLHFTTPRLVVEAAFAEFTHDGTLRHPRFLGLRTDKAAADVVLEGDG